MDHARFLLYIGISLLSITIVAVLMGVWAHKKKGRSGTGGTVLSWAVIKATYLISLPIALTGVRAGGIPETAFISAIGVALLVGGGLIAVIVAILPRRT